MATNDAIPLQRSNTALSKERAVRVERTSVVTSLDGFSFSAAFLANIPIHFARQKGVLGLVGEQDSLYIAVRELGDWTTLDLLRRLFRRPITTLVCPAEVLHRAINDAYQTRSGQVDQVVAKLDKRSVLSEIETLISREDLLDGAARAPVVKLVNVILFEAVQLLASDVHVQPTEHKLLIRVRIDGVLHTAFELPKSFQEEIVSRIKVMARMNIAEKRLPQDGRATVEVGDRIIDLRIASLPTSFGERVVIRLLDKSARLYRLEDLGMPGGTLRDFRRLIGAEHGLLLVTGPTGSGKSTTLYSALQELDSVEHNILTLEDPIEYQLEGISQTQVNDKKGMTFSAGLRNILRQDPDIIMVGEIRDRETATMAIQSAQTGHLVFSTLHTNDAASAITRLLDLNIEPYLLASSLIGVLAQRLVRRVCRSCSVNASDSIGESRNVGPGCEDCRRTGYRGRIGIFELLTLSDSIRQHIAERSDAARIKQTALRDGLHTLRDDGLAKVSAGLTTMTEVEQATMQDLDEVTQGSI